MQIYNVYIQNTLDENEARIIIMRKAVDYTSYVSFMFNGVTGEGKRLHVDV